MNAAEALKIYSHRRDPQAFSYLVDTYNSLVYATCRRRLNSADDVDDAVQEVFVSLARQADSIRSDVAAWLHTCAVRTSIDAVRRNSARQRHETEYISARAADHGDENEARQLLAEVDAAILALPIEERSLILEYFISGRTQEQIASELAVSQSTVQRRLDRAADRLRRLLAKRGVKVMPALVMGVLLQDCRNAVASTALKTSLKKIGLSGLGPANQLAATAWGTKSVLAVGIAAAAIIAAPLYLWRSAVFPTFTQLAPPDGDYFGQALPGLVPVIYAPGIVSIPDRRDMAAVFSADQREAFVSVVLGGQFVLVKSDRSGNQWGPFTPAEFVSGEAREPCLAPDGRRLLFVKNADIWQSDLVNGRWTPASRLPPPVNTNAEEWAPSLAADGTLYFVSSRNQPAGRTSIWRATLENGRYTSATPLPEVINAPEGAATPLIAPDQSFIIFGRHVRPPGNNDLDFYISRRRQNGEWGAPTSLGAGINSPEIEFLPKLSPDGKYFFFSRCPAYGPGAPADIYWIDSQAIGLDHR